MYSNIWIKFTLHFHHRSTTTTTTTTSYIFATIDSVFWSICYNFLIITYINIFYTSLMLHHLFIVHHICTYVWSNASLFCTCSIKLSRIAHSVVNYHFKKKSIRYPVQYPTSHNNPCCCICNDWIHTFSAIIRHQYKYEYYTTNTTKPFSFW